MRFVLHIFVLLFLLPAALSYDYCQSQVSPPISSPAGSIGFERYANYADMQNCFWLIQPKNARSIQMSLVVDTEFNYDWVKVYDGLVPSAAVLQHATGYSSLQFASSTGSVLVQFRSDRGNGGTNVRPAHRGFNLTYTAVLFDVPVTLLPNMQAVDGLLLPSTPAAANRPTLYYQLSVEMSIDSFTLNVNANDSVVVLFQPGNLPNASTSFQLPDLGSHRYQYMYTGALVSQRNFYLSISADSTSAISFSVHAVVALDAVVYTSTSSAATLTPDADGGNAMRLHQMFVIQPGTTSLQVNSAETGVKEVNQAAVDAAETSTASYEQDMMARGYVKETIHLQMPVSSEVDAATPTPSHIGKDTQTDRPVFISVQVQLWFSSESADDASSSSTGLRLYGEIQDPQQAGVYTPSSLALSSGNTLPVSAVPIYCTGGVVMIEYIPPRYSPPPNSRTLIGFVVSYYSPAVVPSDYNSYPTATLLSWLQRWYLVIIVVPLLLACLMAGIAMYFKRRRSSDLRARMLAGDISLRDFSSAEISSMAAQHMQRQLELQQIVADHQRSAEDVALAVAGVPTSEVQIGIPVTATGASFVPWAAATAYGQPVHPGLQHPMHHLQHPQPPAVIVPHTIDMPGNASAIGIPVTAQQQQQQQQQRVDAATSTGTEPTDASAVRMSARAAVAYGQLQQMSNRAASVAAVLGRHALGMAPHPASARQQAVLSDSGVVADNSTTAVSASASAVETAEANVSSLGPAAAASAMRSALLSSQSADQVDHHIDHIDHIDQGDDREDVVVVMETPKTRGDGYATLHNLD
eukprot:TRINITY_DN1966_c0_g1_i1.p1 TRINITY_DN1966_c0_g1~~TRINITY_DN1966_c0_g1_i1.p1  ORF type:complete len:806 (+),score=210.91 TRINITY_DN1966_c0_g1_i1:105-2522(+)